MILTEEEKKMLGGDFGPGVSRAMSFLVEYGEAFGAQKMIKVNSSHILPDPVEWLDTLTEGVDTFKTMTTIHAGSPYNTDLADTLGLREGEGGFAVEQNKIALDTYRAKGAFLTCSCAPYLMGNIVKQGNVFTWAGSSGIIINNSLNGGRGNRESGVSMTCSAITGRTPDMLLTTDEGRKAQLVFSPKGLDLDAMSEADYGAMGYHIGSIAVEKNIALHTLPPSIPFEKLKYLLSPMPVSGAVSMCHITGITPEAATLDQALDGRKPEETFSVELKDIKATAAQLSTAKNDDVDVVMLGCPHLTIIEIREIAQLLTGKKISASVQLWINTNEGVYVLAKRMGYIDILEKAGAIILREICIAMFPFGKLSKNMSNVATNSARCAHYMVRGGMGDIVGQKVMGSMYGSVKQCINAAISGKWEA